MMGFALVAPRKSPRSRLNCAYRSAPSKAVRGPLGSKREFAFFGLMSASAGCGHSAEWGLCATASHHPGLRPVAGPVHIKNRVGGGGTSDFMPHGKGAAVHLIEDNIAVMHIHRSPATT